MRRMHSRSIIMIPPMNNIKYLFLSLAFLIWLPSAFGAEIAEADSAYMKGEYKEAVRLYSEVADSIGTSAPLLFNLGNAAYQDGDYGLAVVSYRRALRLDPGNKEIINNLGVVENKVEDGNRAELKGKRFSVVPDDLSFFESVKKSVGSDVSSNFWAGWAAVCFVLGVICIASYIFFKGVVIRKAGFFGGIGCIALSLLFVIFSFIAASEFKSRDKAVIIEYKVELKTQPDDGAKTVATPLTRGTEVTVLEKEDLSDGTPGWYRIKLNHDFIGWLPAEYVDII